MPGRPTAVLTRRRRGAVPGRRRRRSQAARCRSGPQRPTSTNGCRSPSASATTTFAQHYGTFSYTQSAQAYLAPLQPLMTSQLAVVLGRAFAAPGLAGTRVSTKQVATATAAIVALRAFGPSSLTFVIAITQRLASTKGTTKQSIDYAVTVTGTGTSWQVNDIQLASAGNL